MNIHNIYTPNQVSKVLGNLSRITLPFWTVCIWFQILLIHRLFPSVFISSEKDYRIKWHKWIPYCPIIQLSDPFIQIFFISLKIHGLILSQGFFLSNVFKWRINPYSHNAIRMRIWAQGSSLFIFSFKFSNFSTIFVPVLFCNFLRIWNSFLLISLASKYLQPNFEV